MKKLLFLTFLFVFMLPISILADDGKVCPVEGGSVQAQVTNSPVAKLVNSKYEYEVTFVLQNSSPNFVNATYVIRDNKGKEYSKSRVLVPAQKETNPIKTVVRTDNKNSTFVVDVVEGDCKNE